jgi:hypothetical protein
MRFLFALMVLTLPATADEGMWLFNRFPQDQVRQKYNTAVSGEFLDHLRLSSVRLNSGGSGSFVSPHGLLFTNHHVAQDCIAKLSTPQHDYIKDGFFAATQAEELKCPDLEVNVLLRMETVTSQVKAAGESVAAQRGAIARIERECNAQSGNRCDVVKLFSGERYDLYQFRKYTDLRLVFAPEFAIAFFGGDPDNFTYPRYDLDIAFFRAYADGKPAATPNYLSWSTEGARDGELVFVSGNPGTTSRLATQAQLAFLRDVYYPPYLARLKGRIAALNAFAGESEENRRLAQKTWFSAANTLKSGLGKYSGLRDARFIERKRALEQKLRAAVERDPTLGAAALKVWDEVAAAYKNWTPFEKSYQALEMAPTQASVLLRLARDIVRLTEERTKPDGQRIAQYRDSALRSLELRLYSPAPISPSLEIATLTQYLTDLEKTLGSRDALVKSVLAGRSARQAAEAYVNGSRLRDVAVRRQLAASRDAVAQSDDGMIRLARLLDEPARKLRQKHEEMIEGMELSAATRIAQYRFKMFGANDYPDATFSLRIGFGAARGYTDKAGTPIQWATTFGGLYHKATGQDPYALPARWLAAKTALNPVTPMNFATTVDITGGSSGSPTVNAKGEVVGIVFDGNLESLPNTYLYSDDQARAVHVASQGIAEALDKVYHAASLLAELGVKPGKHATE